MTLLAILLVAATAEVDWATPADATPIPAPQTIPTRYETTPDASATPPTPAPTTPAPAPVTPAAPPTPTAPTFEQRLIAVEIALSTIVVEQPSLWNFDRLEAEAADLLTAASNEPQRVAVRDVAARIDNFRRVGARLRGASEEASGWRSPSSAVASSPSRLTPSPRLAASRAAGGHDATGVLRPVVSQRPDAPKYAVVDDEGRIAALVTPTPDLDARLKNLVGKRVGLDGERGFRTDLRREHLVAERVTPLDTIRR